MSQESSKRPRRIALVDCNNFYVSCERVFHPAWSNRPVGVLSNNDGCIIARSNELKEAGIPMGAPYFKFKNQLKAMNAVVVSSNYALYGNMSAWVMSTLVVDMDQGRIHRLCKVGFDDASARALSALHTRNFM